MRLTVIGIEFDGFQRCRLNLRKCCLWPAAPVGQVEVCLGDAGVCRSKSRILCDCFLIVLQGSFKIAAVKPVKVERAFQITFVRGRIYFTLSSKTRLLAGGQFDPNPARKFLCDLSL